MYGQPILGIESGSYRRVDPFKPGGFSGSGFLAEHEKLEDVISRDRQTLQRYGVTCEDIANKLLEIVDKFNNKVKSYFGVGSLTPEEAHILNSHSIPLNSLKIGTLKHSGTHALKLPINHYIVGKVSTCGWQECPFDTNCSSECGDDYYVYNTETGEIIEFAALLIHMIKNHCFFEGNVEYRLDPEKTIRVLGLDHQKVQAPERKWKFYETKTNTEIDLSTYMQFLPGVYGRLNRDTLELVNVTYESVNIPETPINNIVFPQTYILPNSFTTYMR